MDPALIKAINHYKLALLKYSERSNRNDNKLLQYLRKLYTMPITVDHLHETGIGKVVYSLRKLGGEIKQASNLVVDKWKEMVAESEKQEQSEEAEDGNDEVEDQLQIDEGVEVDGEVEDDDDDEVIMNKNDNSSHHTEMSDTANIASVSEIRGHDRKSDKRPNGSHSHKSNRNSDSKRKRDLSNERDRHKSSRESKKRPSDSSEEEENRSAEDKHNNGSSSDSDMHQQSGDDKHRSRDEGRKHKSKHTKTDVHSKSKQRDCSNTEERKKIVSESSRSERSSSHKSSEDKKKSKHKSSSSKQGDSSSDSDRTNRNSRSKENEKKSTPDKHSSSKRKRSSSEESTEEKKKSHHRESEKVKKRNESKDRKDRSSSKDEKKHKKEESSSTKSHKSSSSKSEDSKSKHKSGSKHHNEATKKDSSSKAKPKIIPTEDGINSQSGASFAEALGMLGPSTSGTSTKLSSKKKVVATSSPKIDSMLALLKEAKLEPLDINISAMLPAITPNYKPLVNYVDNSQRNKIISDDEALARVMSTKNQKTRVYSGNKTAWGKVPTLFDICTRVLQDNIDALEYTGGVPYSILKPVLDRATADQLLTLEYHNPYLIDDTDELWQLHCMKDFRNKQREEMETWREMYLRRVDEREAKFKALTANIKQSQDKSLPVRQTKMAFVDSYVKPPRDVIRKQVKNGISDKRPTVTPNSRLLKLATDGVQVAVPNPGPRAAERSGGHTSMGKPKKAPLMQKALALIKNRYRR